MRILVASTEIGQGTNTILAQIAADALKVDYEIIELEFYLQKSGLHEDPFTHGSDEQRQSGRW